MRPAAILNTATSYSGTIFHNEDNQLSELPGGTKCSNVNADVDGNRNLMTQIYLYLVVIRSPFEQYTYVNWHGGLRLSLFRLLLTNSIFVNLIRPSLIE